MPNVGNFGTIISLVVLGVTWMIVTPLRQSIDGLKDVVGELKDEVKINRRELAEVREELATMKAELKAAHKRIDVWASKNKE